MSDAHMFARAVQCGDIVEVYVYSSAIKVGHERLFDVVRRDGSTVQDDDVDVKRSDNLYRARQMVRRLIWSNQGKYTKFVTLTYRETELDRRRVQRNVTTFVQAMRRKGYDMKYLYVLEHQTERGEKEGNEGAWHVHMVLFVEEYIPKETLDKCWPHGWVWINAIDDVNNLGAYVCKYITKENTAEFEQNVYCASKGLKRPEEERFFLEGLSDTTIGLHPKEVLQALEIGYHSQVRHDYRDSEGIGHTQVVSYFQGRWKDGNIITLEREKDNE